MPPNPRVRFFQPTRSFERSGGQSTFISPLSGTQSLGDGLYMINPLEAFYGKNNPLEILRQQAISTGEMARLAEARGSHEAKRRYGMLGSALEDAVLAAAQRNEDMRLLYQVNSGGRPAGAASFQKGDVYGLGTKDLMDLDFTGPEAGTLHSLGVLGTTDGDRALLPGYRFIQKAQDALGNDNMYLETINQPDFSNLEYYFNLGARPVGRRSGNENPFYEFKTRARREPATDNPDQLRLEGFRRGGRVQGVLAKLQGQR